MTVFVGRVSGCISTILKSRAFLRYDSWCVINARCVVDFFFLGSPMADFLWNLFFKCFEDDFMYCKCAGDV